MYRIKSRRVAALGMSVAVALAAAAQISAAQTQAPRSLPANPQNQAAAPNRQQDPQLDRRDDRQYRGQYDSRSARSPEDRLERRLAYLRDQLRITPAQEGAWTNFTAALRDEARERERAQGGAVNDRDQLRGRQASSVVERLEERRRAIADRGADLDHVLTALRPLYAAFTADQRRIADRLMFQPRGENGRGGFDDSRDRRDSGRGGRFENRENRDYR